MSNQHVTASPPRVTTPSGTEVSKTAPSRRLDIWSIDELRKIMTQNNASGDHFLDYLLTGDYFEGKSVWVNPNSSTVALYESIIENNPHLEAENPYGQFFNRRSVRVIGENDILLSAIADAPRSAQNLVAEFHENVALGKIKQRVLFAGGPAAKIGALLLQTNPTCAANTEVMFGYDGAEQSNESASAHYEHINHANALNAEHDNTGLAILALAIKRAMRGEPDPEVALDLDYHKVDLWPRALRLRDLPLFLHNEIHGRTQKFRYLIHVMNDHDKSRVASKISTSIISLLEKRLNVSFRLPNDGSRALFLFLSEIEHRNSYRDHEALSRFVKIFPKKISSERVAEIYGPGALRNVLSADVFAENNCIRHGFDFICCAALEQAGGIVVRRRAIRELYFDTKGGGGGPSSLSCIAVRLEDLESKESEVVPLSHIALSLGPTARYRFARASSRWQAFCDALQIFQPVPHQVIATGVTAQLLFRITDPQRFEKMPHTGLKQTHFVEVGRWQDLIVLKLTSGGNIGLPVYSRSYALGALANLFRILTPGCGLEFADVICAWPGTRGINGPNNGQVVRLADNAAIRFGEGGTGMSKMGTNAQTLIDMIGLERGLPQDVVLERGLYEHTIIDRRGRIRNRLQSAKGHQPARDDRSRPKDLQLRPGELLHETNSMQSALPAAGAQNDSKSSCFLSRLQLT
jgi:hypothetical protein